MHIQFKFASHFGHLKSTKGFGEKIELFLITELESLVMELKSPGTDLEAQRS